MSTGSILARPAGDGWEGRYHHSDGYPTWMGPNLFKLYEHFDNDVDAMTKFIIDDHPAGWSHLSADGDMTKDPAFVSDTLSYETYPEGTVILDSTGKPMEVGGLVDWSKVGPRCYCHGDRSEPENMIRSTDADYFGAQWEYVISAAGIMVGVTTYSDDHRSESWEPLAFVRWSETPNWTAIECGEEYERCGHYAWFHFPEAEGTRIGTQAWLGREPLEFQEIIGVVIKGVTYRVTGSGHRAGPNANDYHYAKTERWVSSVVAPDGTRVDLPTARFDANGDYKPFPGVKWIYPSIPSNGRAA